ncbi:helicase-exonuclease AddAB subunit AddB [Anoxybacillus flavithermus]|uniref:ATP-dependent helicase/deoxyribonuclease subunit B n=1 Tax=Anoxybacillus flavithermus AK1 TaxID=1297581 RepID=M8E181_9BACL|nr:helicase-exonuclease AddAB subunit AddB [Anoxybacillus flavithermus]EMT46754.1 ATP-dependent nuclease subunit B [Anoxybacillus flavithermus AK1]
MAVRFIIGRSGSGKTTICLKEMIDQLVHEPDGDPIIYIVPEQMTFQSEYTLMNANVKGMIRAQVLSFTRLAWRVLQETGGMSRHHLTQTGVHMLLRKIVEQQKEQLTLFKKAADKRGFIDQLEQMLTEYKRYCVTPEALKQTEQQLRRHATGNEAVLADKLKDTALIFEQFEQHMAHHYVDSEDYLRLLAEKIRHSSYMKRARIYIDGFYEFTPQEYMVLEQLFIHCSHVTVALTLDAPYEELPNDLHVFRSTWRTYAQLREMALQNGVAIERVDQLHENVRHRHEELRHLEACYDARPICRWEKQTEAIVIGEATNRRAEMEGIAREIIRLVRDEGYRYRDIALVIRNVADYRDVLQTVFTDYRIPYFIDEKEWMVHHPFMEWLRASVEAVRTNFRYEAVFRAVKTDLFFDLQDDVHTMRMAMDQLENYVLASGIQGEKWAEHWTYRRYKGIEGIQTPQTDEEKRYEQQLNEWRKLVISPLLSLQKRLKQAKTGRERCEALYVYAEQLHIPQKLERLRDEAEARGDLSLARHHEQVWQAFIDLLDQYVDILGDEQLSLDTFVTIIETGLESLQFSLVPPATDQVLVAHFDRSRLSNIRCTFLVGVNEGVIPMRKNDDGMLSEMDRELLHHYSLRVAPTSRDRLLDEPFLLYLALVSPSERLYVTYALCDEQEKTLLPSMFIKRLIEMFPHVQKRQWGADPFFLSADEQLTYVTNDIATLGPLMQQLEAWKRQYAITPIWWDVYNAYVNHEQWKHRLAVVVPSLFYENRAKPLNKQLAKALYGQKVKASISRMETFNRCPFAHFVAHGLKLKERNVFQLKAPDMGQLFHEALKVIADRLRKEQLSWSELSKQQCEQMSYEAVEQIAPSIQQEVLLSTHRYRYMKKKLQAIMAKATTVLSEHAKRSGFVPIGVELAFGEGGVLPPLSFTLSDGTVLQFVGRIDRIDQATSEQRVLLRIIDYKSKQKTLDLTEVYYGLSLQMLAYLDIVLEYAHQLVGTSAFPAGVLYFPIHNPTMKVNEWLEEHELEKKFLEQFKMGGYVLADEQAVRLMDETVEEGKSSLIIPVRLNKNGTFAQHSKVLTEQQFTMLRQHVRRLIVDVGEQMIQGVTHTAPYKQKDKTACQYCEFRDVCQFDDGVDAEQYRVLTPKHIDEWLKE